MGTIYLSNIVHNFIYGLKYTKCSHIYITTKEVGGSRRDVGVRNVKTKLKKKYRIFL